MSSATVGRPHGRTRSTASLRHRLAERGIDVSLLMLLPALVIAIGLFVYPFSYGIGLTFQPTPATQQQWGGGVLANYLAFFKDPFVSNSVWLTMRLALPAALFNVLASVPMAFKLRKRFRGKKLLTTLLVLPITLGTVLTAQGLLIFAGRQGWLNRFLIQIGVIHDPLPLVNNYVGVFLSLVISGFPFAFLLISSYLSGIDPSIEAAAKTMGAGWGQRFRRVVLPGALPNIMTGLRNGLGYGWRALIATEIIVGTSGIGFLMFDARRAGSVVEILLGMIVLGLLWYVVDAWILAPIERATGERWGLVTR